MRIVAGEFRGREIIGPEDDRIRPTSDRAREALFSILQSGRLQRAAGSSPAAGISGAEVLDVFAGTGALGLEALSRGAQRVTFLEKDSAALKILRENIERFGCETRCRILQADVLRPPVAERPADLIFLDPPYGEDVGSAALPALAAKGWLARSCLIALEQPGGRDIALPDNFEVLDRRRYGRAEICFLTYRPDSEES
jgi:16S rRNA (guanine966-N2)-methyltransferase